MHLDEVSLRLNECLRILVIEILTDNSKGWENKIKLAYQQFIVQEQELNPKIAEAVTWGEFSKLVEKKLDIFNSDIQISLKDPDEIKGELRCIKNFAFPGGNKSVNTRDGVYAVFRHDVDVQLIYMTSNNGGMVTYTLNEGGDKYGSPYLWEYFEGM